MNRRICFVTGSRAEWGLMQSTLAAVGSHPRLSLQIIATGMHTDRSRGDSLAEIRRLRPPDAVIPWPAGRTPAGRAAATGRVMSRLADAINRLAPEIVLVVGDRVEAFAAAAAGHLSDRAVAHVHGGDRATGQADDSLRHAITRLAHVHFAATPGSARRLLKMGEDRWRVHCVGAPGIDGIRSAAAGRAGVRQLTGFGDEPYALLILHPTEPDDDAEFRRARRVLRCATSAGVGRIAIVLPNNDPGGEGIARAWREVRDGRIRVFRNLRRDLFLGLLRDAAVLIGNSSAGIIEAASFGTPVVDIGPRQTGREHGPNVLHAADAPKAISAAVASIWRDGRRFPRRNPYGGSGTGARIADTLASLPIDARLIRKLIAY